MNVAGIILKLTSGLRPVLTKLVPMDILRKIKKRLVVRNDRKLAKVVLKPFEADKYPKGVNLFGNIRLDSGLGQSMRLVANTLEHSDVDFTILEHHINENFSMNDKSYDHKISDDPIYGVNIFHINPHEFSTAFGQLGQTMWDYHYNIGYWLWELEEFPDEWVPCINVLDEIWTPAEFISEAIRKKTNKPVITVPYLVEAPVDAKFDREHFGLPEDKYLYLMVYDNGSMMERKNPQSVLAAFKKAFNRDKTDVGLVIKISGKSDADVAEIRKYLDGYENVYFITETLSKIEINSLISAVDVVVSLHRAEGFGLVLAEAMLNKTPTIATNWSANTEFMNSDVACMVDYDLVELDHQIGPYPRGARWAEADICHAAEYMVKLYEDRAFAATMAEKACDYICTKLGKDATVTIIENRIKEIYNKFE